MKPPLQRIALLMLVAWWAPPIGAHASLDRSIPAARSTVHAPPKDVTLRFTQRLEPAFSRIEVFDAAGRKVDRNDSSVDPADPASLRVSLPALSPGRYRVSWRVLSIDTHVTKGEFTFDVARQAP